MNGRITKRIGLTATIALLAGIGCGQAAEPEAKTVRPAYVAGSWYPNDSNELAGLIDRLCAEASPPKIEGKPLAVIAPHAGYRFSAPVAAAAYKCLKGQSYKRVIGLAFSHRNAGAYQGVAVLTEYAACQTPLGQVPIDTEAVNDLKGKSGVFVSMPGVDRGEHSLELQLPFLKREIGEFKLVPLMVGQMTPELDAQAAQAIVKWVDEDTLIVASSDFTHFGPNYGYQPFNTDVPDKLRELGEKAAKPILACDFDGFSEHFGSTQDTICGRGPIALLLRILSMQGGAQGVRTAFDTSGKMTADWTNSVTYQSFVFTRRPGKLSSPERRALLQLARQTASAYLSGKSPVTPDADSLPAALRQDGACFVTLQNHGQLRGCIGNMEAAGPLYEAVVHNAVQACRDPRFVGDPVTAKEMSEIDVEISYLTPMKEVKDVREVVIGRHGLLIELGARRGVLLPQVAYERGWTREEFLGQVCRKAGLPPDAWKRPEARLHSFEAEVFGEHESAKTQPAAGR